MDLSSLMVDRAPQGDISPRFIHLTIALHGSQLQQSSRLQLDGRL